jgi:hypothetical protein
MTGFDERRDEFEKKFAYDEDLKFKTIARRNRLLGLWAAEKLGMAGDAAAAYAKDVVAADFAESGEGDVVRKVAIDLAGKGITNEQIQNKMVELLGVAVEQIKAGR